MSDEGDKTCPLCAEEMDMTDQQLKPCKCGYEICVWCWHHIMDMAEKDETEGRCPACRTPYNKEKIVGTASSCERLVSDMNVEKKKSQKGKSRTSEGRKQLATVRVIQRNLVYVVGLPLNLADEDLLLRREYFGQYGKVLKVSISRTAAGAIQHSANSTCSVYITYSKEEEAVRCIQSVHGFVLDGRSLRACFGTTKYCHAWLRNVACSNPDCLYLHEIGSQEDSFTKDEIISAYTRSRVQQITGSSNSMQRCSGNVLPPPTDEYCNNAASLGKPSTKSSANTNNLAAIARVSPPNSSTGRSTALPAGASWVARTSNNQPLLGSIQCSNGPLKPKPKLDAFKGPVACSTASGSPSQLSLHNDTRKMLVPNEESSISQDKNKIETLEPAKKDIDTDGRITDSEYSVTSLHSATLAMSGQPDGLPSTKLPPNSINLVDSLITASGLTSDKDLVDAINKNVENTCSDILSVSIYEKQILENDNVQHIRKPGTCQTSGTTVNASKGTGFAVLQPDFRLGMQTQVTQVVPRETVDDLLSFDKQRLKVPEVATIRTRDFSCAPHLSKNSNKHSSQFSNADNSISVDLDRQVVDRNSKLISTSKFPETSGFPGGGAASVLKSPEVKDVEYSNLFKKRSLLGRREGEISGGAFDIGESSIISNILSMDFDTWDEMLVSPQNLAKLMGETDKLQGGFEVPGSLKIQSSNRSRFSFAREEEPMNQASDFGQLIDRFEKGFMQHSLDSDFSIRNGLQIEKVVDHNGFPGINATESDKFAGSHSDVPSSGLSVPRSQISAPPGFLVANRAPPPGFTSHDRANQNFDTVSGNHMLDFSSLLRNNYQAPSGGNNTISNGDIEFMDPAILAVGKETLPGGINSPGADLWSSYSTQLSMYEEASFQSLLQRSLPPHQNERFSDLGDGYSRLGDAYGIPSPALEQKLVNNLSSFSQFSLPQSRNGLTSNGQWDGWNEIRSGNNLGMAELPRNDRLGFNRFYGGYEDSKI